MTLALTDEPMNEASPTGERLAGAIRHAASSGGRRGPRALLILGTVLQPLGGALILLAWSGAANSTDTWEQLPYLISGGVFGLALVIAGGFCYFGYWQTETVMALRRQASSHDDLVGSLERIEKLLERSAVEPAGPSPTRRGRLAPKAVS